MVTSRFVSQFFIVVLTIFLVGCNLGQSPKQEKTWEEQVKDIDNEIDGLMQKIDESRHKANEEERQSLIYMRDDWNKYSKQIQQVEKGHRFSLETEQRITELKKKKAALLKEHSKGN